jgi:hypothetical protein
MRSIEILVQKHALFIEQAIRTRLYDKGTYADGKKIKTFSATGSFVYSPFTVSIKEEKGQPIDRVTLKDSGELYETFNVDTGSSSFAVEFEDQKDDGDISDNIPELDEAIKLGAEGLEGLKELIKNDLIYDFEQEARKAVLYGSQ